MSEEQQEPVYDDPAETEWVLGVDAWGYTFVVQAPNIDPWFIDPRNTEEIGIDYKVDWSPGIYRVLCKLRKTSKYGRFSDEFEDDIVFIITSHTPIMQFGDKQLS